jgi:release factor glutamine methyltransferase
MEPARNRVKNLIQEFRRELSGIYPDQEIRQIIHMLFEEYLGWQKTMVHLSPDAEIPEPALHSLFQALKALCAGRPIQYILGKSWFNGTLLKVDDNVLIPRPETEELCSIIRADHAARPDHQVSILDIGTGSGCIAIDLKKYFPDSEVTAVDNSPGALEIARENARSNHCEISFIHADIMNQADRSDLGRYHLIVSNPPYVMEREKIHMHRHVTESEPAQALFVADNDPLVFYKAITDFAVSHLMPPARLYFEINEQFGKEVGNLVQSSGFDTVRILQDFHGKDRFVTAMLNTPSAPHG